MGCEVVYCEVKTPAHCVSLVIASLSRLAGYTSRVSLLIRIMQVQKISELSMVCVFAGARARRSVYEVESVLCVCVCGERERERERECFATGNVFQFGETAHKRIRYYYCFLIQNRAT